MRDEAEKIKPISQGSAPREEAYFGRKGYPKPKKNEIIAHVQMTSPTFGLLRKEKNSLSFFSSDAS